MVEKLFKGTSSWSSSKFDGVSHICSGIIELVADCQVGSTTVRRATLLVVDLLNLLGDSEVRDVLDGDVLEYSLDTRRLARSDSGP